MAAPPTVPAAPPRTPLPPGATDCHFHVFENPAEYPTRGAHDYVPPLVTADMTRRMFDVLGIARAVIVQPSLYDVDNRCQLDAAQRLGVDCRAVVVVPPSVTDGELADLHARGARGVRFNLMNSGGLTLSVLETLADRLRDLQWHVEFFMGSAQVAELAPRLKAIRIPKVFAHFCLLDPRMGVRQPAVAALLDLLGEGNSWMKLSAPYRLPDPDPTHAALGPIVRTLAAGAPDRLVWGSDWPHVIETGDMPDTSRLADILGVWLQDEVLKRRVLVDNPAALYGFGADPRPAGP